MFRYNELSDLNNGSLVTPLSKADDGSIRCVDVNGQECFHTFDEFDFEKSPSDRVMNSGGLETEADELINKEEKIEELPVVPKEDPEPIPVLPPAESEMTYQDMLDEMQKDDSIYDGSDEPGTYPDPELPQEPEKEGFCDEIETEAVIDLAGLPKGPGISYTVWKDIL